MFDNVWEFSIYQLTVKQLSNKVAYLSLYKKYTLYSAYPAKATLNS